MGYKTKVMESIFETLSAEAKTQLAVEATPIAESASTNATATNTEVESTPATTETPEANVQQPNVETETKVETNVETPATNSEAPNFDDYLKGIGLTKEDLESLKALKQKEKEEAEKPLNESKKWASVIANGIQEGTLTKEDVIKYESISQRDDKDLVFESFKNKFTPSEEWLSQEEFNEELQEAFNKEFPSDKLIKLEAKSIRDEVAKPFEVAQKSLSQKESVLGMKQMHEEIIADVLKSKFNESYKLGDVDLDIEVEQQLTKQEVDEALTKTDGGKELLKMMHSLYLDNKEGSAELYKSFVHSLAKEKAHAKVVEGIWEKASEHFKKVYSIGAQAPFGSQTQTATTDTRDALKEMYNKRNN